MGGRWLKVVGGGPEGPPYISSGGGPEGPPHMLWLLALGMLLSTCMASADVIDRVLAVVNGHLITLSDVRRVVDLGLATTNGSGDLSEIVLSELIDRRLVLEEVERYAPPEPDAETIAERVAAIQRQLEGPAGLDARLAAVG